MAKGIKTFNRALRYANTNRSFSKEYKEDVKAVKKYLEEREELEEKASFYEAENKQLTKLVNIFKGALTLVHKPITFEETNDMSSLVRQCVEIKQNQLEETLRETLRDWVLKNACPKEYKALKEIIALYTEWVAHQKSDFEFFTLLNEIVCKYLSKEAIK